MELTVKGRILVARELLALDRPQEAIAHLLALAPTTAGVGGIRACVLGEAALAMGEPLVARRRFSEAARLLSDDAVLGAVVAAGDLRAAALTDGLEAPGPWREREPPARATSAAEAELLQTRAWALGSTPPGARDEVGLRAAGDGLAADRAMVAGEPEVARAALDRALELVDRLLPQQQRRTELHDQAWRAWYSVPDEPRVRALLDAARRAGDAIGEVRARILLARTTPSDELAAVEAARAHALAELRSLGELRREAGALAWSSGADVPRPAPRAHDQACLVAAGDVRRGDRVALSRLAAELWEVPEANRPHLLRRIAPALASVGLTVVRPGPAPAVRIGPRTLWIDAEACDFGRALHLLELFETVARRGEQLDREALFVAVWRQLYRPPSSDNTLHVSITRLRSRLKGLVELHPAHDGGFRLATPAFVFKGE